MKAYFLSLKDDTPTSGYWDYAILDDLLDGFQREDVRTLPEDSQAVVVVPARSHAKLIHEINTELKKIDKVVLFLMGDEEHDFPVEEIRHECVTIWVQNPEPGRHDGYEKLGCGYAPHVRTYESDVPTKSKNWFFSGQITHERRQMAAQNLRRRKDGGLVETPGFTQGLDPTDYCQNMAEAKVAPCPAGPQTPDTFRLYEALELGCVPVADEATPKETIRGFWDWLFGEPTPFPKYTTDKELTRGINLSEGVYPQINNETQAWWYRWRSKTKDLIRFQSAFHSEDSREDTITVIIPISPIASHPDTAILEETIGTIRHHLPKSKIILTFDGVRKEQEKLNDAYQEHIRRVLWKCRTWKNVVPYIFSMQTHQVAMARVALQEVTTPLILYVEQDTPIVIDEPIEWEKLIKKLLTGDANMIRLHFEGVIPEAHTHLMIGTPEDSFLKTVQWSQRPHLARTDFYTSMLQDNFSPEANCFIEDRIHGKVQVDFDLYGEAGWAKWKVFIYHPMTGNIKRSYHVDGRHGEQKYDDRQIW